MNQSHKRLRDLNKQPYTSVKLTFYIFVRYDLEMNTCNPWSLSASRYHWLLEMERFRRLACRESHQATKYLKRKRKIVRIRQWYYTKSKFQRILTRWRSYRFFYFVSPLVTKNSSCLKKHRWKYFGYFFKKRL